MIRIQFHFRFGDFPHPLNVHAPVCKEMQRNHVATYAYPSNGCRQIKYGGPCKS
jgi:hypothetical protein